MSDIDALIRDVVRTACMQEREPSVDNQNKYWASREALSDKKQQ